MDWLRIFQLVVTYGPVVKQLWDAAISNDDMVKKLETLPKQVASAFEAIGAALFPDAAKEIHVIGGLVASIDPDVCKWIQGSLNILLPALGVADVPMLDVDGMYGPKTTAAVKAFQKRLGLAVDGIAGAITQAALQSYLSQHPKV